MCRPGTDNLGAGAVGSGMDSGERRRSCGFWMLDPVILGYGKGQLTGFPFDPNAVVDVKPNSYSAIIGKALWSSIRLEQAQEVSMHKGCDIGS
ncbi:hypothetical protein RHMOL_Rhmol04G0246800 [Rhododendron molle]|uniref:Uncharacterized protein n=1 Tax=Rhododendron molle TaxID=49168 RepID=A0ACC0P3V2_RHOML|nr:hypothetical protein RHMOL_Rhmol04G0246800 [Rhododendron molle]